jgi:hypothetical protein
MTPTPLATVAPAGVVTWHSPHPDLWVGLIDGIGAGVVEFVDGHFVVNRVGQPACWTFGSLLDAKNSVECPEAAVAVYEVPARPWVAGWLARHLSRRGTAGPRRGLTAVGGASIRG